MLARKQISDPKLNLKFGTEEERRRESETILKIPSSWVKVKQVGRDIIKHLCEINNMFLMSSFQIIV